MLCSRGLLYVPPYPPHKFPFFLPPSSFSSGSIHVQCSGNNTCSLPETAIAWLRRRGVNWLLHLMLVKERGGKTTATWDSRCGLHNAFKRRKSHQNESPEWNLQTQEKKFLHLARRCPRASCARILCTYFSTKIFFPSRVARRTKLHAINNGTSWAFWEASWLEEK